MFQERNSRVGIYSPPYVDGTWGIWGSYFNLPKTIVYLLKGNYPFRVGGEGNMIVSQDRVIPINRHQHFCVLHFGAALKVPIILKNLHRHVHISRLLFLTCTLSQGTFDECLGSHGLRFRVGVQGVEFCTCVKR